MVKKNHTLQNILKFQNAKFECLQSLIWISNQNIQIYDLGSIFIELILQTSTKWLQKCYDHWYKLKETRN